MTDTLTEADVELARTLRMAPEDVVAVAKTIAQSPRSTIEPTHHASQDTPGLRALADLGGQDRAILAGLDVAETIGEGGMGIVRLATQRSLGRKVAVKTLRPLAKKNDAATLRLLREAWVTGMLEHPNIVPVYDAGLDEAGSPIIVLKRIEGVEWGAVIRDGNLERHLRILVQLCNAVSLAHARGVLHRDLKPENVMIGSFGEVYLVDWGIAVSLRADPSGRLPLAAEQKEMAGTPCYMAPEMLGAAYTVSERTDVYLLGAILHEILTGAPPHEGSFQKIVGSILLSQFSYSPDVPRELAAIAKQAMARDPVDRFASAEAVRDRIEWYLGHRSSLAISAEANKRLVEMRALVARTAPPADHLHRLLAECRFGFRQALSTSPENAEARDGLREAIAILVRFELARGGAEAAAGALAELEDPPDDLVQAVGAAQAARADDRAKMMRLEAQAAQLDPAIGRRTRVAVAGMLGVFWTLVPQVGGRYFARQATHPWWQLYVMTLVMIAVGLLGVAWGWQSMTRTIVNRRIVGIGCTMFGMQLALELGTSRLGLPFLTIMTLHMVIWALSVTTLAMLIDRRFWLSGATYTVAFFVACASPAAVWNAMSAANLVVLVSFLVAWWRPREDVPRFLNR